MFVDTPQRKHLLGKTQKTSNICLKLEYDDSKEDEKEQSKDKAGIMHRNDKSSVTLKRRGKKEKYALFSKFVDKIISNIPGLTTLLDLVH